MQFIVRTVSGHLWLIESAEDEADALRQYQAGGAEEHTSIDANEDEEMAEYLRDMGQAS
jgi:hypothetical protein